MTVASLLGTTLPTIMAIGVTGIAMERLTRRNGKPVGSTHYHYKGKRAVSHKHEGGHISHTHRGLRGYGKSKTTLRR